MYIQAYSASFNVFPFSDYTYCAVDAGILNVCKGDPHPIPDFRNEYKWFDINQIVILHLTWNAAVNSQTGVRQTQMLLCQTLFEFNDGKDLIV